MRKNVKRYGLIPVVCISLMLTGMLDQTTKDALKVQHVLRTIERRPQPSGGRERIAEVTEKELNAYIAHRLEREKKPLVDSITIGLLDNNHVRGTVRFNSQMLNLDTLLGDNLSFDFKGIFHTRNRAARLDLISLYLGGYPVKPQVLAFVLDTAATYSGTEVFRIDSWYQLPKGIKRITFRRGKAIIYY
jgi:hypothetical protein